MELLKEMSKAVSRESVKKFSYNLQTELQEEIKKKRQEELPKAEMKEFANNLPNETTKQLLDKFLKKTQKFLK